MKIKIYNNRLGHEEYIDTVDASMFNDSIPQKGALVGLKDKNDDLTIIYKVLQTLYDYADNEVNLFVKEYEWGE